MNYKLAPNGIFYSLQGEAHLRGFPMVFVRLAGCSIGCPGCDTNYSVNTSHTPEEISRAVSETFHSEDRDQWVWITGGEPADVDLRPLVSSLKDHGFSVAVATSGAKRVIPPVDWLSVSPHSILAKDFQQRYGNEIKLVDGLNGLSIEDWVSAWNGKIDFMYRYVQPISIQTNGEFHEDSASLERCIKFISRNPRWALSRQDHHHWRLP